MKPRPRADNGIYFVDLYINGKRRRVTLKTRQKRVATQRAIVRARELGADPEVDNVRLYDFLDQYEEHSKTQGKQPGSIANEKSIIKIFKSIVKDQPLRKFNKKSADKFFSTLHERSRKRHGVEEMITAHGKNLYLRALRTMWNLALTWKMVAENPFKEVSKFVPDTKRPRVLDEEEIKKVLTSLIKLSPHLLELTLFYLYTGMRRNEALDLEWDQVDFKKSIIHIKRGKRRKDRDVPLFAVPKEILERRQGLKLKKPFYDAPAPSTVTHQFADIVADSGIPHAKLHDLRKTYGTILAENNVSPYTIIDWLGHTNNKVTLDFYIGMDTKTAARLDDLGRNIMSEFSPTDADIDFQI
jgi:integrase